MSLVGFGLALIEDEETAAEAKARIEANRTATSARSN